MSDFNITKMRSALRTALDRIGRNNGHAMPDGVGSNFDRLLHEQFIASEAASYFDKRRKTATEEVMGAIDTTALDATITRVASSMMSEDLIIADGAVYQFLGTIVSPSKRLDKTKLRNELSKIMSTDEADALLDLCSTTTKPPTRLKVLPKG